ncbi:Phosphoribosylformylglycinamidine synthase, glutamine amidotransferase subunit [hydrothermal vent metagenome]|uniref:Phosphoribosylformylglycinamidine synthase, glutamine amidotransferase subunit n=1 Tax=hydrothermal vent metagenome TaxID=652676 RepID=A0A3B0SEK1_9ZZZZ
MTIAVVVFPGTNCEHDITHALNILGTDTEYVWHRDVDISGADGIVLPGGFAHGDYLRTGAIARLSPIMSEVERCASEGLPIVGVCNGFQILCEAGILPGALIANRDLKFICKPIHVRVESNDSVLTRTAQLGQVLRIPLNSYEGNYVTTDIEVVEAEGGVILRYCDRSGEVTEETNPNGSTNSIAGIVNRGRNVAGLMPHPERAVEEILGSSDGRVLLESFIASVEAVKV